MSQDSFQGLTTFVRAVEAGSFTGAARQIGTTPSAVSRTIARLERRLGTRLFQRSTRAFALTPEGQGYFDRIAPLIHDLEEAEEALIEPGAARGQLRVSLPADLGRAMMDALCGEFLPGLPGLTLDVAMTDRHVDLIREGFDVAIRVGHVADSNLIARHLGMLPLVLVASPAYLAIRGVPDTVEALRGHAHIRYRLAGQVFPIAFADGTLHMPMSTAFDTDSGEGLRIAALNGLGIAQILRASVQADLDTGRLREVLPDIPLSAVPVQALHAFARTVPMRARVFMEFAGCWLTADGFRSEDASPSSS